MSDFFHLENHFEIIYVVVCINSLSFFLTHLPFDGCLVCFKFGVITNKTTVNICILVFVWIPALTYLE